MDLSIVVLAAGQGTRMKSPLPKVLHTIGGKPMLSYVIQTAKALKCSQLIVVHGYGGDALKAKFQDEAITWVEQAVRRGTGDAVQRAMPQIPSHHQVLVLYGDVPLISAQTLKNLIKTTPTDELGLITAKVSSPAGLGRIVRTPQGQVSRIVEEGDANDIERQITEINTGILIAPYEKLGSWLSKLTNHNAQKEFYLTDIVQFAVSDNVPVATIYPQDLVEVQGVNDRVQQAQLERYYQLQCATQLLRQGVWIADPARFDLRGSLEAHEEVYIDVNVVFEGSVLLNKGARIGPNCVLINCEIGENVTILANCHIENAKIERNAVVGPFARLRPGTQLKESAHIGNFVEIKNAIVGQNSKINHLSYIGDALIGKNVNVGAGTITCNYDGAHKHQTIIEDDAHIGSDSQLIAPVRVGKGATLAAGTTLHKDAPPYQLTLTHRLEYQSKEWSRPVKDTQQNSLSETEKKD